MATIVFKRPWQFSALFFIVLFARGPRFPLIVSVLDISRSRVKKSIVLWLQDLGFSPHVTIVFISKETAWSKFFYQIEYQLALSANKKKKKRKKLSSIFFTKIESTRLPERNVQLLTTWYPVHKSFKEESMKPMEGGWLKSQMWNLKIFTFLWLGIAVLQTVWAKFVVNVVKNVWNSLKFYI